MFFLILLLILDLLIITTLRSFMCFSDMRALAGSTPHLHEDPNPIKKQKRLSKKGQKENRFSGAAAIMGAHISIYFLSSWDTFHFTVCGFFFSLGICYLLVLDVEISLLIKSVLLTN